MTTIDCPWCEAPIEADLATAQDVTCDTCVITVAIAADPAPVLAIAA
jgi:hypothetical protein